MNEVMNKINPFIIGFSLEPFLNENHIVENCTEKVSSCHDEKSEIQILIWLHNNNYIDATLCILSNDNPTIVTLDCKIINPKLKILQLLIKNCKECYLKNYNEEIIHNIIKNDTSLIFEKNNNKITC